MQIVIDINDNLYTRLFDNGDIDAVDMLKACTAIRKGTPLPEYHGRLIDADNLVPDADWSDWYDDYGAYSQLEIDEAKTIIEARRWKNECID